MATRKKKTVKAKAKSKSAKKKVVAKKAAPKKKAAPRKAAPKKTTAPAPKPGEGDIVSTQQLAIAEIVGDIEERMALDRLTATVE